jgi:tRNA pseudouridine synthase 10
MTNLLEKAQRMLEKYPLCSHCLGRQFALLGYGLSNQARGETLKLLLTMKAHQLDLDQEPLGVSLLQTLASNASFDMATGILKRMQRKARSKKTCYLCKGQFDKLQDLANLSIAQIEPYEYSTFLVGIDLPTDLEEREDEFKAEFAVEHGESVRSAFSREIGKRIAEISGKETDYKTPEVVVLMNPFTQKVNVQVNPIYVAGRYRKLVRDIPQSRWLCSKCRGKGCKQCNWTGKMYPESVEELIGEPLRKQAQGEDVALHGAGREDVDARMLGPGRPFVIEVKKPKKRNLNLSELAQAINKKADGKVRVSHLRLVNKEYVRWLKKPEAAEKVYRVIVEFDKRVHDKDLLKIEQQLPNATVRQQTPRRVLHRRADLVREKHIYEAHVKRLTPNRIELKLRCQGGLYIKELITGDEGRTIPNVADLVGSRATPLELDVLNVLLKEEN